MRFKIDYSNDKYFGDILDTEDAGLDYHCDDEDMAMRLFSFIVDHVLEGAAYLGREAPFSTITVEEVYGSRNHGDSVDVSTGPLMDTCRRLVWLHSLEEHEIDMALALIENQGWDWFDFDNRHWAEAVSYQTDEDDYTSVSKRELEILDKELDSDMEEFFDYDAHGRRVAEDDYETVTFNGTMYLMGK